MNKVREPSTPPGMGFYELVGATHDYASQFPSPVAGIAICTYPRCGSTLLGEALTVASTLGCPLEYFHPPYRRLFADRWQAWDHAAYIRAVQRHRTDPSGTLSVKLFWSDVAALAEAHVPDRLAGLHARAPEAIPPDTYREIGRMLADILPDTRFVHLQRRDRVRRAVSAVVAAQTGIWRRHDADTPSTALAFEYDAIAAQIALADRNAAHWRNLFAAIRATPLEVAYEDLADDPAGTITRLLAALGRAVPAPPLRLTRQSGGGSEALVARFLAEHRRRVTAGSDS